MRIVFHGLPKSLDQDFLNFEQSEKSRFYRASARQVLTRVIGTVLKKEKKTDSKIEIIFLSRHQIEKLNFNYRKKKEPTDVLSFSESADNARYIGHSARYKENYLGEILICIPEVRKNAKIYNQEFEEELKRVLIHGILHLLGYNHEEGGKDFKIMMAKQEKYLSSL